MKSEFKRIMNIFATDIHLMPNKRAIEGFNQAVVSINGSIGYTFGESGLAVQDGEAIFLLSYHKH